MRLRVATDLALSQPRSNGERLRYGCEVRSLPCAAVNDRDLMGFGRGAGQRRSDPDRRCRSHY
jgi:hypothetical protein